MTIPSPFRPGRFAKDLVSPAGCFAAFYDAAIERRVGGRVAARDLRSIYLQWAAQAGAQDLSFKQLRKLMVLAGHRHIRSNGMMYLDAALVEPRHFDIARGIPGAQLGDPILTKIDRALASLTALRDEVVVSLRTANQGNQHHV